MGFSENEDENSLQRFGVYEHPTSIKVQPAFCEEVFLDRDATA